MRALRCGRSYSLALVRGAEPLIESDRSAAAEPGTVLIIGGTKGLGLSLAKSLIEDGAKDVVVTSRDPQVPEAILRMAAVRDCSLSAIACDTSDVVSMCAFGEWMREWKPNTHSVYFAAGQLALSSLSSMTYDSFWSLVKTKCVGAYALRSLFPYSHFGFFSSVSSTWGQSGASHYAASNSFLDALSALGSEQGLSSTSVNFGPFSSVGMASSEAESVSRMGLCLLSPGEVNDAFRASRSVPGYVFCGIRIKTFSAINQLRGSWPLLARLATESATWMATWRKLETAVSAFPLFNYDVLVQLYCRRNVFTNIIEFEKYNTF